MANYSNITQAGTKGKDGGYKPVVYLSPVADIDVWAKPIAVPVALGDMVKIVTAHEWVDGKAAVQFEAKLHGVKLDAATVGDPGSAQLQHTVEFIMLGDDAALYESIVMMLNDKKVIWIKDANCIDNDSYVQIGNECEQPSVTASFASGTTAEGLKTWTIQMVCKAKYFYLAALDVTV